MKFKNALQESSMGKAVTTVGTSAHRDTGISPTGHITGEYGEAVLPIKKKKKKKMEESTTSTDVTGTGTPHLIDWFGPREKKKKDEIIRRKLPKYLKLEK